MIKVVHVVLSLEVGGLENGLVNLVNNSGEPFVHVICCLKRNGAMGERLKKGVKVYELGWEGGKSLSLPFRLASVFRKERCDIARCMNIMPFLYGFIAARIARVPRIVYSNGGRKFNEKRRREVLERVMANRADSVIAVSRELAEYMSSNVGIERERITTIDNGVDMKRFDCAPVPKESLSLPKDSLVIGSVGRLVPEKDYKTLIEAFAKIKERVPSSALVIAGGGPEMTTLRREAEGFGVEGSTRLTGPRNDIPGLLRSFDIFVLPSLVEGFSNVILEAMAAGLPIVATNAGDNARLVDDGNTGYVVPPGDSGRIEEAVIGLLLDGRLRERLGAAGRARVEEKFSIKRMVASYESIFSGLAAKGNEQVRAV